MNIICQKIRKLHKKNHTQKKNNGEKIKAQKTLESRQKEVFNRLNNQFNEFSSKIKNSFPEFKYQKIREKFLPNEKRSNIGFLKLIVKNGKYKVILEVHLHVDDDGQPDRVFNSLMTYCDGKILKEEDKKISEVIDLKSFLLSNSFEKLEKVLRIISPKNH